MPALSRNNEASNLWSFFHARTVRMTTVRTVAEHLEVESAITRQGKELADKRVAAWKAAATRYDSEPATQEGRKEITYAPRGGTHSRDSTYQTYGSTPRGRSKKKGGPGAALQCHGLRSDQAGGCSVVSAAGSTTSSGMSSKRSCGGGDLRASW